MNRPDEPPPARVRNLEIAAVDGYRLAATLVEPPHEEQAVLASVLINPATAVKRGYYLPFARFLAQSGLRVLTLDYRGIGDSRPARLRGFEAEMKDWAALDSEGALRWLADRFPKQSLVLIGHSFGGQSPALIPSRDRLDLAVTVAAQSGYWRHWPGLSRWRIAAFWYLVIPILTRLWGYFPAKALGIAEDLPAGVALQWARWGRQPKYIRGDEVESWERGFETFRGPVLAYSFSDDTFAPPDAVRAIQGMYSAAGIESRARRPKDFGVSAIGHFGCFRERFEETLWSEILDWLQNELRRSDRSGEA